MYLRIMIMILGFVCSWKERMKLCHTFLMYLRIII